MPFQQREDGDFPKKALHLLPSSNGMRSLSKCGSRCLTFRYERCAAGWQSIDAGTTNTANGERESNRKQRCVKQWNRSLSAFLAMAIGESRMHWSVQAGRSITNGCDASCGNAPGYASASGTRCIPPILGTAPVGIPIWWRVVSLMLLISAGWQI